MKVLVLAGGDSNEREVSLTTGQAVCNALAKLGYEVKALDPASGQSLLTSDGTFILENKQEKITPVLVNSSPLAESISNNELSDIDIVFIALHGGSGENGTIQNLLQLSGIKYTGSDMAASAVAMNKGLTKRLMKSVNVNTPKWVLYKTEAEMIDEIIEDIQQKFPLPLVVKPNESGSTVGLTLVKSYDDLKEAIETAAKHSSMVLVEEYIEGRELTVSVIDGTAYPIVEILPKTGLYDYEAKYTKGKSEYQVPAKIEESITKVIQESAVRLYNAVNASGLARVDFMLSEDNVYYCLEINTLPGMTSLSLSPMSLKAAGYSFEQLVDMIIKSGIYRKE
jgi:D-alanine-D-alanine ligase